MTTPSSPDAQSVDELVQKLRERVAERQRAGEYPPRLVADLDAHFARIAAHRAPGFDLDVLRSRISALEAASSFSAVEIGHTTRVPGGSFVHRVFAKLARRQTEGILAQTQRHADAVREALREIVAALETPAAHTHVDLVGEIQAIFEKLSSYERARGATSADGIVSRVEALEERAVNDFKPWYSNERFEARFRGDRAELQNRYRDLADTFAGAAGPIVDIGCGRGEFVELLLELGADARGIDIDSELVASGIERGLPIEYGDAVAWLEAFDDGGLGGLSLIQVVEHLTAQDLADVVRLAARKVRSGGRVIAETVNPQSLYTFAHALYLDPTHRAPVHPSYLAFLFEEAGFEKVDLQWRSPCPADDRLEAVDPQEAGPLASLAAQVNSNSERVNRLLFAEQDYALIAVR